MLKTRPSDLDYLKLIQKSPHPNESTSHKKVKISILADCTVQYLATILQNLLLINGFETVIYEGIFGSIEQEVYEPSSQFNSFESEVVVILNSVQSLRAKFYGFTGDRINFESDMYDSITSLWKKVSHNTNVIIIQSTFVPPYERFYGNYDSKAPNSLGSVINSLNNRIKEAHRSFTNVFLNDIEWIASYIGRKYWFDERMWILSKSICAFQYLPYIAQNIVDIYLSTKGHGVKCIVLDCDNTLWGGMIGDDGLEGIKIGGYGEGEAYIDFQKFLLELKKRGILLAICSQNDLNIALLPFQEHPGMIIKEKDIVSFVANFDSKVGNIKYIKESLGIGYDTMVFLDDDSFQRNLVRKYLPEVIVPELPEDPAEYRKALSELNLFETSTASIIDEKRTELYIIEAKRDIEKSKHTKIEDYLESLQMKIEINRFNPNNMDRIIQLIQRSNQFNLTTQRYIKSDCERFTQNNEQYFPFCAALKDKYGDNGIVSIVILILNKPDIQIDTWIMSCRVLKRGVEDYLMNYVFDYATKNNFHCISGSYIPTSKNGLVKDFYKHFGFKKNGSQWMCRLNNFKKMTTYITPSLEKSTHNV